MTGVGTRVELSRIRLAPNLVDSGIVSRSGAIEQNAGREGVICRS